MISSAYLCKYQAKLTLKVAHYFLIVLAQRMEDRHDLSGTHLKKHRLFSFNKPRAAVLGKRRH